MDGLNTWLTIFLNHLNAGLALGVVLAVLLLLRPLLLRLLTPQQRVAVWYVAWSIGIFGNLWGLTSLVRVLPVTVWDLLGPRPGGIFGAPAFLPPAYDGPGEYPVVLPGGETAAVELNSGPLLALSLLWAAVAVGLLLWYCHRSFALMCWGRQGSELEEKELVALGADRLELWMQPGKIDPASQRPAQAHLRPGALPGGGHLGGCQAHSSDPVPGGAGVPIPGVPAL